MSLLSTGGFMLMPFSSAFAVGNLKIDLEHLPMIYLATGAAAMVMGPVVGKSHRPLFKIFNFCDWKYFFFGHGFNLYPFRRNPLWEVVLVNAILFAEYFRA